MTEMSPSPRASPSAGDPTERPRKRLRKGTKSCWECKRRKVRCIFAAQTDAVCNECRRRGTSCISQEFPDAPVEPGNRQRAVEDRLGRLEVLVETLLEHLMDNTSEAVELRGSRDVAYAPRREGHFRSSAAVSNLGREMVLPSPRPLTPATGLVPTSAPAVQDMRTASKYDELSRQLSAAWPNQHDLDLLLSVPDCTSNFLLYKAGCVVYDGSVWPRGILRLPPPGSHPITIARKLLLLSIYLRGASSSPAHSPGGLTPIWHDIMSRLVDAARLVIANDELVASFEGIECLIVESMYHDAVGNLPRAGIAIRRAMAMAQMMGLHRAGSASKPPNKPESGVANDPEQIWFRLVQADRYISLMLGLPRGSSDDNTFASPNTLEDMTPLERMRRLDVLATGLILQRNESNMHDTSATREIDKLLQKSAAGLPPQWWLPPNPAAFRGRHDAPGFLDEVMRLMDQSVHYHLLIQLHLPYLLCPPPTDPTKDVNCHTMYSKITALTASREMLTRYVAFHQVSSTAHYCRGVDFLAFIGSSTLCLAHLEASRQRQDGEDTEESGYGSLGFLAHQRPSDRGLVEQVAAALDEVAGATQDAVVARMGAVLGQLLAMEDGAASRGVRYTTEFCSASFQEGLGYEVGRVSDDGDQVRICIPHFGGIEVKRVVEQGVRLLLPVMPEARVGEDDWALPGVDLAFEKFIQGLGESEVAVEQPWAVGSIASEAP